MDAAAALDSLLLPVSAEEKEEEAKEEEKEEEGGRDGGGDAGPPPPPETERGASGGGGDVINRPSLVWLLQQSTAVEVSTSGVVSSPTADGVESRGTPPVRLAVWSFVGSAGSVCLVCVFLSLLCLLK